MDVLKLQLQSFVDNRTQYIDSISQRLAQCGDGYVDELDEVLLQYHDLTDQMNKYNHAVKGYFIDNTVSRQFYVYSDAREQFSPPNHSRQ